MINKVRKPRIRSAHIPVDPYFCGQPEDMDSLLPLLTKWEAHIITAELLPLPIEQKEQPNTKTHEHVQKSRQCIYLNLETTGIRNNDFFLKIGKN